MATQQNGLYRLQFKQPLNWKAGRAISIPDLLKRLSTLSQELRDVEQEEFAKETLSATAKELASQQLLAHKDRGVRAYTAHCLVDVLRLFAPDAPYASHELKEIYSLFINTIIHSLSDPNHPYSSQHLYVINSLAEVKSIILLADVPGSSALVAQLFRECFDILTTSGNGIGRHVEYNLNGILNCMVEESETLPPEAVDLILAQFLHADPAVRSIPKGKKDSTLSNTGDGQHRIQKPLPASYNVAKNICNSCVGQMARYASQYFGNVIIDASSLTSPDAENESHTSVSEEDLGRLQRAHRLLRELWRACPGVLQNVIPQIEAELSAENEQIRSLSTRAIGDLIAGIGAGEIVSPPTLDYSAYPPSTVADSNGSRSTSSIPQSFSQSHTSTFQLFLGRRNDKSHHIRSAWAHSVGRILATSAGETGVERYVENELISNLSQMMNDSDERVRMSAIQAVGLLNVHQIVQTLGSRGGMESENSLLFNLAERARDKRPPVRSAAITFLARSWAAAFGEIAAGNEKVKEFLGSAPSRIFNAYYINDRETNHVISQVLFECLCPIGYPALKNKEKTTVNGADSTVNSIDNAGDADSIRTERILILLDSLDAKAKHVFFALITQPKRLNAYLKMLLQRCEDYNGGINRNGESVQDTKEHLDKLIAWFAKKLPDVEHADGDLRKFADEHDRRSYALIRFCMAHDSDYRKIQKSLKELDRKMSGSNSQKISMNTTVHDITLMNANLISNKSHVRPIIAFAQSNERGLGAAAHEMLKQISTETPNIFKSHSIELCRDLVELAPEDGDMGHNNSLDSLKACASFARRFPGQLPKDRKFMQAMSQYALYGSPPVSAKHAVTIIMSSTDSKQMYAKDLARTCIKDIQYGQQNLLTRLACLSQLMLLASEDLEDESDTITDIAINNVLKLVRTSPTSDNDKSDWTETLDTELQAKIWALKILVNRLRHYDEPASVSNIYSDTYKMLNLLVCHRGELSPKSSSTPLYHRSRLHLQAAFSFFKLSSKRGFDTLLGPTDFHNLCLTAQDPIPQVRSAFVTKLRKLLGQERLPARFHIPVFLLAFEPTDRLREDSTTWLRARANTQRLALERAAQSSTQHRRPTPVLEYCLSRLISLLAHHPDFSASNDDLTVMGRYITFYLSTIAVPSNLGLINHIAQRVKSVADNLSHTWDDDLDPSERLYILSDLTQAIIHQWKEVKGWRLDPPAERVSMPSGIFKPLPNSTVAKEIATKNYLPADVAEEVEMLVRIAMGKPGSKKRKSEHADEGRAKKRSAPTTKAASARLPKRLKTPPEQEEESGDESEREWGSGRREGKGKTEPPSSERRQSERASRGARKSYRDNDDMEDEKELMDWQAQFPSRSRRQKGREEEDEGVEEDEQEEENEERMVEEDEEEDEEKDEDAIAQVDGADDEELSDVPDNLSEHDQEDDDEAAPEEKREADGFDIPDDEDETGSKPASKRRARTSAAKAKLAPKKAAAKPRSKAAPKPETKNAKSRADVKKAEPKAGTRSSRRVRS